MRILNLTEGFDPFPARPTDRLHIPILKNEIFSGGEINFRIDLAEASRLRTYDPIHSTTRIVTRLNDSADIMRLLMATEVLRETYRDDIEVFFPYTPYARQDRVCNDGEAHALRVFADLINAQGYSKVITFDAHSYVTESLIRRCKVINNHKFVGGVVNLLMSSGSEEVVLITPDAGAEKKGRELRKSLSPVVGEVLHAQKVRDRNGEIVETRLDIGDAYLEGCTAAIVDDICDGGRSFFPLAKLLKQKHAKKVVLVVSHGIFSHNFADTFDQNGIDAVYATDSIRNWTPNVTIVKMKDFL